MTPTTTHLLDRLRHRSVVITLDGESYRPRDHHARTEHLRRTTTGTPGCFRKPQWLS